MKKLPFAGASCEEDVIDCKVFFLATIDNKTVNARFNIYKSNASSILITERADMRGLENALSDLFKDSFALID